MKKYIAKLNVYSLEEAFFDTLSFVDSEEEAMEYFRMIRNLEDDWDVKQDAMLEFMENHKEWYEPIPEEIARIFGIEYNNFSFINNFSEDISITIE